MWPTDDETTRWVDVVVRIFVKQPRRARWLNDVVDHPASNLFLRHRVGVLSGNHDRIDPSSLPVDVLDGYLALAVRAQPIDRTSVTQLGDLVDDAVRESDWQRHQFRRLIAGITKHQALVASSICIDTLRDICTLAVQLDEDFTGIGIESNVVTGVADIPNDVSGDLLEIDVCIRCDLARQDDQICGAERLAGNA